MKTYTKVLNRETYETNDYDSFKKLKGNRDLHEKAKINALMASFKKYGWIGAPVIVNENMEVIDGQNRIEACRILGIPVQYQIIKGLGIKDCITLNTNQENWDTDDFVYSYATQGLEDYVWIVETAKLYSMFTLKIILALCHGKGCRTDLQGQHTANIKSGGLDVDNERRKNVINTLDFLLRFDEAVKKIGGRKFLLYNGLIFFRNEMNCDEDRLVYSVNKYAHNENIFPSERSTEKFIECIEKAYNFNRPRDTHITGALQRWIDCTKYMSYSEI